MAKGSDCITDVLNEYVDVEVYNHSPHVSDDFIQIHACSDPDVAYNNCHAVSSELYMFTEVPMVRVDFSNGTVHYANSDCSHVVDYTARQYDPAAPFPLVLGLDEWVQWANNAVKNVYPDAYVSNFEVES